ALYSLRTGQCVQITDALHDSAYPAFDPDGKHLYFTAATNATKPGARNVYAVSLQSSMPAPESGRTGMEGFGPRIHALPAPAKEYSGLAAGNGILFLLEGDPSPLFGPPNLNVDRLDMKASQVTSLLKGVTAVDLSADGKKALFQQGDRW